MNIYNLSKNGAKIKGVDYISTDKIDLPAKSKKEFPDSFLDKKANVDSLKVVKDFVKEIVETKVVNKSTGEATIVGEATVMNQDKI